MSNAPYRRDRDASTVHLPPGPWRSALDALCAHFPAITRAQWLDRIARGRVLDGEGVAIDASPDGVSIVIRTSHGGRPRRTSTSTSS